MGAAEGKKKDGLIEMKVGIVNMNDKYSIGVKQGRNQQESIEFGNQEVMRIFSRGAYIEQQGRSLTVEG